MVDGLQGPLGFLGKEKISRLSWEFNYSSTDQPKAQREYTTYNILVPMKCSFFT